jgi:putative transposase
LLEAEMTEHVGAAPYELATERKGHRNRHKVRPRTRVGTLNLLVPQDREGTFSTRKVKSVTERLCDTSFSKSPVSSLADRLDSELQAWESRPLEVEAYPYLFVDPRYEKVRVGHRIVSQGVLIVSAVRAPDGFREILGVEVTDTESEATYQDLFRSLKERVL